MDDKDFLNWTEPAKQASDKSVLLAELLNSNVPKSEREHVAVEKIESLESLLHRQGWDIERLKITIKQLQDEVKLQNKDWCDDDEAIKQQALRVLPKEAVEGDSVHVPRMGELAEMMANEIMRLRKVLETIVDPIKFLRIKAEEEGLKINGMMASMLSDDANYLKELAKEGLEGLKHES